MWRENMSSEKQIEKTFIDILTERENQWSYRSDIKTEASLWDNLREHINRINLALLDGILLTDHEFEQLKNEFRRLTQTPFMAAVWLRGESGLAQITIERDDIIKRKVSLTLFSNKDIAGGISSYEVVNQIVPDIEGTTNRGDVTLLINGLPIIHIELKNELAKDGYMQAFRQIERYAKTGFFDGIYATVQIFVISNKVATRYFARPGSNDDFLSAEQFIFNWREPDNKSVDDLYDFTSKVLSIPTAHELISRFTILVDDKKGQKYMMVLRAYQIHAIKQIIRRASQHEGGFIWHATGSGKTITSFVATKLLAQLSISVARTVMIVDRQDLDSQTKDEFSKFASEYNTGVSTGKAKYNLKDNTFIIKINNKRELVENFLSKKNNNTIIITTIQKLSYAIRESKKTEVNKLEKLKGEHIVFIVDECHRAVSDKEMKSIKKIFPKSTWIGLTGTPIFEENKKQENGTYARTTYDQYGELLHAYTTKNAMEDKSVLDFQVEYHSLMSEEEENIIFLNKIKEKYPKEDAYAKLTALSDDIEKEALLESSDYENDNYIEAMLKKIFKYNSIIEKFKIVDGMPTMSGILTTHSIKHAKRIFYKLIELKNRGELITGKPIDERRQLNDPDFPRIAITYSVNENQEGIIDTNKEFADIMGQYNEIFGTTYKDANLYNKNINKRLSRKEAMYQKDGQWLDLVIVVDRLLTGFDSPTIQALYVDRELRYQKLLQAFSRTNRTCIGKSKGMIVTFRKPKTMAMNVRAAIKLFSNEECEWENLIPKEYFEVKKNLKAAYIGFQEAKKNLAEDRKNIKKQIELIKTFQTLNKLEEAIKSYEEYEVDVEELSAVGRTLVEEVGHIENVKAEVKKILLDQNIDDDRIAELIEIEFSSDQRANFEERIDSYYIAKLLRDIKDEHSKQKFYEIIQKKPSIVKATYEHAISSLSDKQETIDSVDSYFKQMIDEIITEAASTLKAPKEDLQTSFNEYRIDKEEIPYINIIIDNSTITRDEFEGVFHKRFRERRRIFEAYWRGIIENRLMPLKGELINFVGKIEKMEEVGQ